MYFILLSNLPFPLNISTKNGVVQNIFYSKMKKNLKSKNVKWFSRRLKTKLNSICGIRITGILWILYLHVHVTHARATATSWAALLLSAIFIRYSSRLKLRMEIDAQDFSIVPNAPLNVQSHPRRSHGIKRLAVLYFSTTNLCHHLIELPTWNNIYFYRPVVNYIFLLD